MCRGETRLGGEPPWWGLAHFGDQWRGLLGLLGLRRALFQVISKLVADLEYLEPAVGLVLGFIGIKLVGFRV